jgi:hypothetical protein
MAVKKNKTGSSAFHAEERYLGFYFPGSNNLMGSAVPAAIKLELTLPHLAARNSYRPLQRQFCVSEQIGQKVSGS